MTERKEPWCIYHEEVPRVGDVFVVEYVEEDEWDPESNHTVKLVYLRKPNSWDVVPAPANVNHREVFPDDTRLQYSYGAPE